MYLNASDIPCYMLHRQKVRMIEEPLLKSNCYRSMEQVLDKVQDNNKMEEDKNNDKTIKKEVNLESSTRKCSVVEIESEEQWFAMLGNMIQNKSIENK